MAQYFQTLALGTNLLIFLLCAGGVWMAGARLTYIVDALSDRFNLAKSLMGLLVLSLATSLPEVATTLSAAVRQSQALVLNNLFGGIALQTAILATADLWARGAITNYPRKANHALEATLLVVLLSLTLAIILAEQDLAVLHVGYGSLLIGAIYCGTIWLLRKYEGSSDWVPVDQPEAEAERPAVLDTGLEKASLTSIALQSALACLAILLVGITLVASAETIAVQSGLGAGFIGVTLLAAATSLPELTTTITAVRLGAYTMAISNIFGSNLIMLVLVLPADMLYVAGPILSGTGPTVPLAICFGIIVTAIYLVGLIVRRKPRIGTIGIDSLAVMIIFLLSVLAYLQA
ncbi:MAG: hypothetical protein JXR14_04055 [Paracoccaceae bacterium]